MQNIDPIVIILFIPILDRFIYPALRKGGIAFKTITRITFGFVLGAFAMGYAAVVQNMVYSAGPCYDEPLKCSAAKLSDGTIEHNRVHVAIQTPAYVFTALSEIFASVTGLEYAYTKAPESMKSFVMSLFLLTNAGGAALGLAISPVIKDPQMVWFYTSLAVVAFITGVLFWLLFKKYNAREDAMNDLNSRGEKGPPTLPMPVRLSRLIVDLPRPPPTREGVV